MTKARIHISKQDIFKFFDEFEQKIFKPADLATILSDQREYWRLAQRTTSNEFIRFLIDFGKLERYTFPFPYRQEIRYSWGKIPLLEVLMTVKPDAYFSHYTAMRMHGLTEQVPKTIYLNHEQQPRTQSAGLEQGRIAAAFSRKPRESNNVIEFGDERICLINGMHTGQLGIINKAMSYDGEQKAKVRVTNLERTLIDIAVRPVYSGGLNEVRKAYQNAKDELSVTSIATMLQKLRYVYPYHQAIGYYLELAGVKPQHLELLKRFPIDYDFYLGHQMGETDYIKDWRLFVPKGF